MGKLSIQDKVCILICWALTLMYSTAEREYFLQTSNLTWDEGRNHCQVCFKELMTATPANIQNIALKLNSDHWIGLRKNFNSTSNSSMPWTRWANGDPLTFQNWYPGWPVFKSPLPKRDCCSCSCTCPAQNGTNSTDFWEPSNTTNATLDIPEFKSSFMMTNMESLEATCTRTPMLPPDEPDTDQNYIEDSCVVMLSFGTWVERNCTELLPFICYEDRFNGKANVIKKTTISANITWLPAPGNISHYYVEVRGDKNQTYNLTDLTYEFVDLTEGVQYSVQVFPVKCERLLNPQNVTFYTHPNKVVSLDSIKVTETSVSLNWSKPAGNVDFYRIDVQDKQFYSDTENIKISNLIPGNLYTFTVRSGVNDNSTWSKESNITVYTKPGKVTSLSVSDNTKNSLWLSWVPPEGNVTGFWVTAVNDSNFILYEVVTQTESSVEVTGLPIGTKITLSVTALVNGTVEGDKVTVVNHTDPGPISNLILTSGYDYIVAMWDPPVGSYSSFTVNIQLDGIIVTETPDLTQPTKRFNSLKAAANYTVTVYTVSGHLSSLLVAESKYTLPLPPTDPSVTVYNETHWTLRWKAPNNTATVRYCVKYHSSFWGHTWTVTLENQTSYTFDNLNSGTKYEFEVQTIAEELSTPAIVSFSTDADKREVTLSMLCSSQQSLLCDRLETRKNVFEELKSHFNNLLGDDIYWELVHGAGKTGT